MPELLQKQPKPVKQKTDHWQHTRVFALVPAIMVIAATIWMFRFMWLYIPLSVLMPVKSYMKALSGFMPRSICWFCFCIDGTHYLCCDHAGACRTARPKTWAKNGLMLGHFIGVFISVTTELIVGLRQRHLLHGQ